MKLLLLSQSTTAHFFGGVETHVDNVGRAAADLGHDVTVITTALPHGLTETVREGIRTQYLEGTPPGLNSRIWWRESAAAVRRHCDQGFGDLLFSFGMAGYGIAETNIVVPHYVFANVDMLSSLISEWHNCAGLAGLAAYPKRVLSVLYWSALERHLWSRIDGILATHDDLYEKLHRTGYVAYLCYNGIDSRGFALDATLREATRRRLEIPPSATVLLMLGTVNRQKGMWLGVRVFRRLAVQYPELHLLVVGDGTDLPRLRQDLAGSTISARIHFTGAVSADRIAAMYAASDLFLYPTLRMEGLPFAILYALAAGLPVVASDRGGIASAVKNGITGLLVRPGDAMALTEAVERLLQDRGFARSLAGQGQEFAAATFENRRLIESLLNDLKGRG